jgi:hypothetical protein
VEERRIAFRVHGEGAEAIPRLFIVFFSTSQTETTAGEPKNPTIRISSLLFVSVVDSIVIICFLFTLFVFLGLFSSNFLSHCSAFTLGQLDRFICLAIID